MSMGIFAHPEVFGNCPVFPKMSEDSWVKLLCHSDLWVLIPCYMLIRFPLAAALLSFLDPSKMEHNSSFFVPSEHLLSPFSLGKVPAREEVRRSTNTVGSAFGLAGGSGGEVQGACWMESDRG